MSCVGDVADVEGNAALDCDADGTRDTDAKELPLDPETQRLEDGVDLPRLERPPRHSPRRLPRMMRLPEIPKRAWTRSRERP